MAERNDSIRKSPRDVAESLVEADVIAMVQQQPLGDDRGWSITGMAYPTDNPVLYIKYGHNTTSLRDSEARTQQFAYDSLQRVPQQDRQGIRIPEIYRVIEAEDWTYIIMEFIRGKTLRDAMEDRDTFKDTHHYYYDNIERALKLLLSFPVPKDAAPGPYGGGIIRHPLFNDYRAPIQYDSVEMLEKHLNNVSTAAVKTAPTISLERDLHFVFADLYEGNFMFTDDGDTYVIDFEQASFLPLIFMTYAMIQPRPVVGFLRGNFDLPQENLKTMRHIGSMFVMSWRKIGLPL